MRLHKRYVVAVVVETERAVLLDEQGRGLAAFVLHCIVYVQGRDQGKSRERVGGKKEYSFGWDGVLTSTILYRTLLYLCIGVHF